MFANLPIASNLRYELPPSGNSLLGYVVRRMHKTTLLTQVRAALEDGQSAEALMQVALYAVSAAVSFGPAYYQPRFNRVGAVIAEADPVTGALITARLESTEPHYRITHTARMPDGSEFSGVEVITGTTVGWGGLGMPAPSRFQFTSPSGAYTAEMVGTLTSELTPGLWQWRIRGHGGLRLSDNQANIGQLKLGRDGVVRIKITAADGRALTHRACIESV
jgi:hypothetical protein